MQHFYGIVFNETCINKYLPPKYTDMRTNDLRIRFYECAFQFRRQIIEVKLENFREEIRNTQDEKAHAKQLLTEAIPDRVL